MARPGISSTVSGVRDTLSGGYTDGWAVGEGAFIKVQSQEFGGYRCGYITTSHGVVGFYDQLRDPIHTSFDFAHGGRVWRISWDRAFSDRFLKTLAKRFAAGAIADTSDGQVSPGRDQ